MSTVQVVSILHHLLRLEPSCRLVDFGAGACKLASQLYRYLHLYLLDIQMYKITNVCHCALSRQHIFFLSGFETF